MLTSLLRHSYVMLSASQASSGVPRKDNYSSKKMGKEDEEKIAAGKFVLPPPNPKSYPDMIEAMVGAR